MTLCSYVITRFDWVASLELSDLLSQVSNELMLEINFQNQISRSRISAIDFVKPVHFTSQVQNFICESRMAHDNSPTQKTQ
jgi:hypothetical protein